MNMCLFCGSSMSADAMDGSQVLVCFDCEGYEGKEMQVDEDFCCKNYNGPESCMANNINGHVYFVNDLDSLKGSKENANRIAEAVYRTRKYIRK